jgi:hypothetical protein
MESKKPWLSKTIWMNLMLAVAPFIPGASEWMASNASVLISAFAVLNMVLRLVSKDKIGLSD